MLSTNVDAIIAAGGYNRGVPTAVANVVDAEELHAKDPSIFPVTNTK